MATSSERGKGRTFTSARAMLGNERGEPLEYLLDDSICNACAALVIDCVRLHQGRDDIDENKSDFDDGLTLHGLQISDREAMQGSDDCSLCGFFIASLYPATADQSIAKIYGPSLDQQRPQMAIVWEVPLSDRGSDFPAACIRYDFALARSPEDALGMPFNQPGAETTYYPSSDPASEGCFSTIRAWMEQCMKSHDECQKHSVRASWEKPMRLLDVMPEAYPARNEVRLVVSSTDDTKSPRASTSPYLALSYSWGKLPQLRTTRTNIAEHMEAIPFDTLAPVHQDAIRVARATNIKYIWIDALCICQDDDEEWRSESARMCDIYAGSLFTLSALRSVGSHDSVLQSRRVPIIPTASTMQQGSVFAESLQLFIIKRPISFRGEINVAALSGRAWSLQERYLAPAVLSFGHDQISWECGSEYVELETGDTNVRSFTPLKKERLHKMWGEIVEEYSKRQLTYPNDRLVALSGLTRFLRLRGYRQGRYAAGLWEEELLGGLLWSYPLEILRASEQSGLDSTVPVNKSIPHWSWARRDGVRVEMYLMSSYRSYDSLLSALPKFVFADADQAEESENDNTLVESCYVSLRGFVQTVSPAYLEWWHDSRPQREADPRIHTMHGRPIWNFDEDGLEQRPVFTLLIARATRKRRPEWYYLLLTAAESTEIIAEGVDHEAHVKSRRVGMMSIVSDHEDLVGQPDPADGISVFAQDGKPILTDGRFEDILLV